MNRTTLTFVVLLAYVIPSAYANSPTPEAKLKALREFVDNAPRSDAKIDREYAIKISAADRRKVIELCDRAISNGDNLKAGNGFHWLSEKLLDGEGKSEAIAVIPNSWPLWLKLMKVLSANQLRFGGIFNGPKGLLTVKESQAKRARSILAKAKAVYGLPIEVGK